MQSRNTNYLPHKFLNIQGVVISMGKCLMQSVMQRCLVSLKSSEYPKPNNYAVCGVRDTFAENGFVHLKQVNGMFSCTVKNCRTITGGKQLKSRNVCLHIHLLSCCLGLWKSSPLTSTEGPTTTCSTAVNFPVSSSTTALPSAA